MFEMIYQYSRFTVKAWQTNRVACLSICLCLLCSASLPAQQSRSGQQSTENNDGPLGTFKEKSSYSVGYDIGKNLAVQEMDFDLPLILQGIAEAYQDKPHQLKQDELRAVMTVYMQKLEKKQLDKWQAVSRANLEKGETFLQKNRNVEGVKQFESGLQFKVIEQGDGASPKLNDQVKVHVRSANVDGVELDNSHNTKEPLLIAVGSSPPGWAEALQKMSVGDKWTIYVPSDLAYGPNGLMPLVGPNETLIFDIELLEIVAPEDDSK